jgi:hypothetical protein
MRSLMQPCGGLPQLWARDLGYRARMLHRQNGLFALWMAFSWVGCASDYRAPQDAGASEDAAASPPTDAAADAILQERDPTILRNFSFDDAKPLELGPVGALQPLESADQVDYFSFEAEAGEVYALATARGRFSPDNVIAFYDPHREKLAENDVGGVWPGDLIDARLIVRARESGTHYVVIEDRQLPQAAFESEDIPTFFYRVTVTHLEPSMPGVAFDDGATDQPTAVELLEDEAFGVAYVTVVGELSEGETDRFTLHGGAGLVLVGHVLPGGITGNGSTLLGGIVGVRDAAEHLVAEIDRGVGTEHFHPPVADADYTLSVRADGALGDNAFYAIDLVLLPDNPGEEATDNDTLEAAQALELKGGFLRRGTILAELPPLDQDYFAFEAQESDRVDVRCEGQSAGSGVRELRAEIRDAADEVLGNATEAIDTGLFLSGVTVGEAGTYYLRLSSATPKSAEAAPAWVRCAVIADR